VGPPVVVDLEVESDQLVTAGIESEAFVVAEYV